MQRNTQSKQAKTAITLIREHLQAWQRANRWSRETLCGEVVAAHERIGADVTTGVVFDPPSKDTYERARVNADRITRWLDDHSKDSNLLTVNMLWSVLSALPQERRLSLLCDLLEPVGVTPMVIGMDYASGPDQSVIVECFKGVVGTGAEVNVAMAALVDGIDPGEKQTAIQHLTGAASSITQALAVVKAIEEKRHGR